MNARTTWCTLLCTATLLASMSACLGPGPTDVAETKPDSSRFSARIDGDAWAGTFSAVDDYTGGNFVIHGTQLLVLNPAYISIYLFRVTGTGVYPLGKTDLVKPYGASTILYTKSASTWSTPDTGTTGTITITKFTISRMAGTFAFTATPTAGFGPNHVVTEGDFDLPITAR